MSTITIPIPDALARIYERASEDEKRKAQWLVELVLRDLFRTDSESLIDVVRDVSERAAQRGMTPALLEELLRDDDGE